MHTFFMSRFEEETLSLLRLVSGFLFLQHGVQKLFGLLEGNQVELFSLMGLAGFIELFGGLFIMVGLFTRPVAFVAAGEMAVAYFMVHLPQGFWPILNGGEPAAFYCFLFLYLSARGAGPWSVDAALERRAAAEPVAHPAPEPVS